ncbi:lyase [Lithospermum erythrorhizon]|uniref:Pectate lyase n=1 Tax=Lithospermum erythrorhizon TaxID=34254 RepID=A0AAV3PHB3_LITER
MEYVKIVICVVVILFLASEARANIDPDRAYWNNRAEKAKKVTQESYRPETTKDVNKKTDPSTNTRRDLLKYTGPCKATNPIDECWRCDKDWAVDRMKLADCAMGFGWNATGGKGGKIYVVTDPSDDDVVNPKIGTLRHAVIQEEPLWIIFQNSMNIKLKEELIMTSHKTIDGRGAQIHIAEGAGFTLQFISNVIIHNIRIHDIKEANGGLIRDSVYHYGFRTKSDGDGISIFGSSNIWIDHVSMSNCKDGLIDAVQGSTAITVSNGHYTDHNDVMLFGASDNFSGDEKLQVTVAFNHYGQGLIQRMPRIRWGFAHVVNNDYTMWQMYAIGGSSKPTILSQGNRFYAPNDTRAKEVTSNSLISNQFEERNSN